MGNEQIKHVVVAIISRLRKDNIREYLLIKSKSDFGVFTGCFYPPGGHVEDGESEEEALVREEQEELGIIVHPVKRLAQTPGDIQNQITYWWECEILSDKMSINESEIADVGWFTESEIGNLKLWPATRKFFEENIRPMLKVHF